MPDHFTYAVKKVITLLMIAHFSFSASAQVTVSYATSFASPSQINSVAYGNGKYVAVGYYSIVLSSTDGKSWAVQKISTAITPTSNRIAFGNGIFAVVASDGSITTSPDGTNWTLQSSGTVNSLSDIIYANGKFIAIGNNGTVLTSTDGITWTASSTGAGSGDYMQNIIYAQGKFIIGVRDAANGGSKCYYSTTGASGTWTGVTISTTAGLNKLVFLNNKYFCFTISTNIFTSTNATSWSAYTNTQMTTPNQMFNGFFDGTKSYIFGTTSALGYGSIFSSTDDNTWTLQPQTATLTTQSVAYLNGMYFQTGNEGLVYSTDGVNYKFPGGQHNAVTYGAGRFVAVGQVTSNQASIFTSTDWSNWSSALTTFIKPLNGVVYGGGKFVAVGNTDPTSTFSGVATSTDGLTWTTGNSGFVDNLRAVAYGNGKYVAVGLNGRILYSSNGTSWLSAESVTGYAYYGVSYLNNRFIAVGGSTTSNTGMAKVKYSSDGINWTDASPGIVGHFHAVTYGNSKYMLVGRDNVSTTLKFFSITTPDITSVASYSTPVTASTTAGDVGTSTYGAVTYNGSNFIAVANLKATPFSAFVLTSTDGTSWTSTAANTVGRLRGIVPVGATNYAIGTMDTRLAITTGNILPLRLLSFSGIGSNDGNKLSWKTSEEINTSYFVIERSEDGSVFNAIGQCSAVNKLEGSEYHFSDTHAVAKALYYRLKMVDKDDKFSYSNIVKLQTAALHNAISVFPNPADGNFTLSLPGNGSFIMSIFNGNGDKLLEQSGSGNTMKVDITSFKSGTFVITVKQGGNTFTEKLIKR